MEARGDRSHVVMIGMMGVGKTTTARALGGALGWPVRDSDTDVERLLGRTGADLAADGRVDDLHRLEEAVLLGVLARGDPHVIAAAGWVVESSLCREALRRRATVVHLTVPDDVLVERYHRGDHRRPLTDDELLAMAGRRRPLAAAVTGIELEATRPVSALVEEITNGLGASRAHSHE